MRTFGSAALALACAGLVTIGCGKKSPATAPQPPLASSAPVAAPAAPPPPARAAEPARELSEKELFARKSLEELNAERPLGVVYFDVDQSVIRADARTVLQRNADWLRRWGSTRITIEGHCDERGTNEYNLALGERRAHAVKSYLASLGVAADRVHVVSMGKEAPSCTDASEGCWQQNRRGHPFITAK